MQQLTLQYTFSIYLLHPPIHLDRLQQLTQSLSETSESTKKQDQYLSLSELQAASNSEALMKIERLCTQASALAVDTKNVAAVPHNAILTLTAFVMGGKGHPSARRMAIGS